MTLIRKYPLSALTVCSICVLSLAPLGQVEIGLDVPFQDKWAHFVMYGVLTSIIWWEYWRQQRSSDLKSLMLGGILFPELLGGTLELLQAYCTTYRSGDWLDFAANSVGVLLGVILGLAAIRPWWKHRHAPTP